MPMPRIYREERKVSASGADIYLPPKDFDAAVQLGLEMEASIGGPRSASNDPNGFAVPHRFVLGMLGEFAFATFLNNFGIRYDWSPKANGKSDNGDFVLYVKGKPVTIDVKTLAGYRNKVMLAEREYLKNPHWRYVVVRQQGGETGRYFTVEGICGVPDLTEGLTKDGRKVWECELSRLRSIAAITAHCDTA